MQRWVPYTRISPNLKRAVLAAEDDAFFEHEGVDLEQLKTAIEQDLQNGRAIARRQHDHAAAGEEPLSVAVARSAAQAARADHRAAPRSGAVEGAHLRDLSERDRVGRRHLGRRSRGAHLLRHLGRGAVTRTGRTARRRDHQSAGVQSGASAGAAAPAPAHHPARMGGYEPPPPVPIPQPASRLICLRPGAGRSERKDAAAV